MGLPLEVGEAYLVAKGLIPPPDTRVKKPSAAQPREIERQRAARGTGAPTGEVDQSIMNESRHGISTTERRDANNRSPDPMEPSGFFSVQSTGFYRTGKQWHDGFSFFFVWIGRLDGSHCNPLTHRFRYEPGADTTDPFSPRTRSSALQSAHLG